MCYGYGCPHELGSGKCGKKKSQLCPDSFESDEDYEEAVQKAQDDMDDYGDYLYEQQRERSWGL
jgi:hypothetical protein